MAHSLQWDHALSGVPDPQISTPSWLGRCATVQKSCESMLKNKWTAALATALLSIVILLLINPPIIYSTTDGELGIKKRSWSKILMWSGAAAASALLSGYWLK